MASPSELHSLSAEELHTLHSRLEYDLARRSPLDLAQLLYPETRRWPHLVLLNDCLTALAEYRLTAEGPVPRPEDGGPTPSWWYTDYDGVRHDIESPFDIPDEVQDYGAEVPAGSAGSAAAGDYGGGSGRGPAAQLPGTSSPASPAVPIVFQLAFSMRPRAGKSRITTETFPLWCLLQDPYAQIGLATYSDDFAAEWGGKIRDKAAEFAAEGRPWFPEPAAGPRAPRSEFVPRANGRVTTGRIFFVGTGGAITGKTLHVRVADDLIKNDEEAQSSSVRRSVGNFLDTTWNTRATRDRRPGARFPVPISVLMSTRWHHRDPIGHQCFDPETKEQLPGWFVLNIPALCEDPETDPLHRSKKDQAHPHAGAETRDALITMRNSNPRVFSALFQGRPAPAKGTLFPVDQAGRFRFTAGGVLLPSGRYVPYEELTMVGSADMAATKNTTSDWTIGYVAGVDRETDSIVVLSQFRERVTTDQYGETLLPFFVRGKARLIAVENVSYGQVFGQALRRAGMRWEPMPTQVDKVARAMGSGMGDRISSGRLLFPEGQWEGRDTDWVSDTLRTLGQFPYDDHDDEVDALAFLCSLVETKVPKLRRREAEKRRERTIEERFEEQVMREHARMHGPGSAAAGSSAAGGTMHAWRALMRR